MLNISVDHNNAQSNSLKECYNKNIVCGTISNFQFDYLKHEFERNNVMGERKVEKNWVILDEVDSLVVDQGSNIAKLSGPFPGMENLRFVYLNIWLALHNAE